MSDMSDTGGQQPTAPETSAAPETTAAPDWGQIESRFEALQSQVTQGFQALAPQPEPEAPVDPYAPLNDMYDEDTARQTRETLESIIRPAAEQYLSPAERRIASLEQRIATMQANDYAADLEERYPALKDPAVVARILPATAEFARELGIADPAHPRALEMAYLADVGRQHLAGEVPPGGAPQVERAGGAAPPEPEPDYAQNILNAGHGEKFPGSAEWGVTY